MIRALARDEIPFIFELAAAEGWNSGLYDAAPFYAADPNGFFVAEEDAGMVGCIAAVRYETFGFIGLFIVRPEFRGKGIGTALFKHALAYLDGLPVGLDAVLDQEARYEQFGFKRAYTSVRYRAGELLPRERHASGIRIERLRVLDDDVTEYDGRCFGSARSQFLQTWIAQPDVVARVARSLHDGTILGFGVGREARAGTKVGPLFASRLDVAGLLFEAIALRTPPPWRLDVPAINFPGIAFTDERHMVRGAENARMWRGNPPAMELDEVYGVTSFELG